MIRETTCPKCSEVDPSQLMIQQSDLKAKAYSHIGLLDQKDATLQQSNAAAIKLNSFLAELDRLPELPKS
jgi:hypothetical protein